jgi:hypothetical protein
MKIPKRKGEREGARQRRKITGIFRLVISMSIPIQNIAYHDEVGDNPIKRRKNSDRYT